MASKETSKLHLALLQHCLRQMIDQFTWHFINKKNWLHMEYWTQEKENRILVIIRILQQGASHAILKSAMYCTCTADLYFLKEFLAGLVLTLAVEYVF